MGRVVLHSNTEGVKHIWVVDVGDITPNTIKLDYDMCISMNTREQIVYF